MRAGGEPLPHSGWGGQMGSVKAPSPKGPVVAGAVSGLHAVPHRLDLPVRQPPVGGGERPHYPVQRAHGRALRVCDGVRRLSGHRPYLLAPPPAPKGAIHRVVHGSPRVVGCRGVKRPLLSCRVIGGAHERQLGAQGGLHVPCVASCLAARPDGEQARNVAIV